MVAFSIVATAELTRYDYRAGTEEAAVRLAWQTSVPRVVECRRPTEAELENLPIHMRQEEICEGQTVAYRLTVEVDGRVVRQKPVRAEGVRADRPLQVFEELRVDPGPRRVRVVFERADTADVGDTALPDRVVFDRSLRVEPHEVVLITYDPGRRELVRRGEGH
jgi:hypothetical protein